MLFFGHFRVWRVFSFFYGTPCKCKTQLFQFWPSWRHSIVSPVQYKENWPLKNSSIIFTQIQRVWSHFYNKGNNEKVDLCLRRRSIAPFCTILSYYIKIHYHAEAKNSEYEIKKLKPVLVESKKWLFGPYILGNSKIWHQNSVTYIFMSLNQIII